MTILNRKLQTLARGLPLLLACFSSMLEKISAGAKLKDVEKELVEAIKQHKSGYTQDA